MARLTTGAPMNEVEVTHAAAVEKHRAAEAAHQRAARTNRLAAAEKLELGRDADAKRAIERGAPEAARYERNSGAYGLAASAARYAMERGDWKMAAGLAPRPSKFPYADAMTHFARAVGAARSGDIASAEKDAAELARLRDAMAARKDAYWTGQVEIQRLGTQAWLDYAAGRRAEGLAGMRQATDREAATDKAAVSPGPLAPARELYGEMLLDSGDFAGALAAFEATLRNEPNRFRATAGAARAARAAGDSAAARSYSSKLLELCARGDQPGRREVVEARSMR